MSPTLSPEIVRRLREDLIAAFGLGGAETLCIPQLLTVTAPLLGNHLKVKIPSRCHIFILAGMSFGTSASTGD